MQTMTETTKIEVRQCTTKFYRNPATGYVINGRDVTKAEAAKAVKDNNLKLAETIKTTMHTIYIYR